MFVTALAISSFFYQPHPRVESTHRPYALAGWRIGVDRDTFTGAVSCTLKARNVSFRSDTLIFHLRPGLETTHAVFRVDGGAARPVSVAFHEDEAHGIFPQKGFIDDPAGGDVALPASYLRSARRIWIRPSPTSWPRYFVVYRFSEALARAKAAGCPAGAFRGGGDGEWRVEPG